MSDLEKDLDDLLHTAREALALLRHHAESLETQQQPSHREREVVRRLNRAIQLVEFDRHGQQSRHYPPGWD